MPRQPAHKKLVDAIVDSVVTTAELAKKAEALGIPLADRLTEIVKAIIIARSQGRITAEKATELYVQAYTALTLAGFVDVAQDALDHAATSTDEIHGHARALKQDVHTVEAIRKPDFLARALEKANGDS